MKKKSNDILVAVILVFGAVFGYVMFFFTRKEDIAKNVSASSVTFDPKFTDATVVTSATDTEEGYKVEFTPASWTDSGTLADPEAQLTILKSAHKKGDYPKVEVYENGQLVKVVKTILSGDVVLYINRPSKFTGHVIISQ